MRSVRFHTASTLDEAIELKAATDSDRRFLAGGTDLVVALREQRSSLPPVELIDISRLRELKGIVHEASASGAESGRIRLGPLTTFAEIERSELLAHRVPLLVEAAMSVGAPQVRNRGTIGGNIVNASSCADSVPPLVALGAELTLRSVRGIRTVPLEEAIRAPYETVLEPDEIVSAIGFACPPPDAGSAFVKLGRREALSISRMSIAAIVETESDVAIRSVRIAAGSVTPTVRRFRDAEAKLTTRCPDAATLEAVGREVAAEMIRVTGRRWSTPYKEPVVARLVARALSRALERSCR